MNSRQGGRARTIKNCLYKNTCIRQMFEHLQCQWQMKAGGVEKLLAGPDNRCRPTRCQGSQNVKIVYDAGTAVRKVAANGATAEIPPASPSVVCTSGWGSKARGGVEMDHTRDSSSESDSPRVGLVSDDKSSSEGGTAAVASLSIRA
ncbi:hypothetical protein TGME49_253770 [Toxoplasma gondii ME49]|uniref:Uncharacterized protein n=8 Tax=Toxoplasma gondii TaxID=5811 RepID=A0A2G8XSI1_TOXGO|nr:hypothetical protein TGME49_253770 [Toxoplasma gondii ME49]KFG46999.1 hypothetical protein TGP89_253770 [Toxoplasma gondii p89]KFG60050.1 hypothetical protein TGRUB_253770 [Toxoplasma gondii RUB]KFH06575.1 hypothetical protein TGVAND_253770 [Toxoplasma gondii VAND]KFH14968.1 hypothetical protein TGMAS_253770 [Toxoplasma gondii MAS]KYF41910.1 hypothetical protein TGARI_253770 [Toxoplasma gondii ARI]PIL97979.1 hypothetical protein TGCOUG_253770 [Toxoplasma gondii COUG]PUA89060.1 hypothetica|eukprot:XP_018638167.1 hypothetical protein TGME49_253770 [Toxoplasma gondii ME49]